MELPSPESLFPPMLPLKKRKLFSVHFYQAQHYRLIHQGQTKSGQELISVAFDDKQNSDLAPSSDLQLADALGKRSSPGADASTENLVYPHLGLQALQVKMEKTSFNHQGMALREGNPESRISSDDRRQPVQENSFHLAILQNQKHILHCLEKIDVTFGSLVAENPPFVSAAARCSGTQRLIVMARGSKKVRTRQNWTDEENRSFFRIMEEMGGREDRKCIEELMKVLEKRNYEQIKGKIKNMREAGRLPPKNK